ncbi:hypothetical protein [Paenibacillus xanthanilyticus]|uniref:Phage metallopeptidase domain-containing protein n=1 Tax=Paenibacillus xanthanilyticus TaxID=1783531 RepID=A0ABV8K5H9_9BACL
MRELEKAIAERIVRRLLEASGSTATVILKGSFPGGRMIGGKYSLATHTITMYLTEIASQCVQLFGSDEQLAEYFEVVLAHELGHAEDPCLAELAGSLEQHKTAMESARVALLIEENAWSYAMKLLPHAEPAFVDRIIEHSLASYFKAIEQAPA